VDRLAVAPRLGVQSTRIHTSLKQLHRSNFIDR